MPRLYPISPKKLEKLLFKLGFEKSRQKGSHAFYKHPDGRVTTIPHHPEDIRIGLLSKILKDIQLAATDYLNLI
jgi:predicted RNA binding protein YcfA (HicA-like mRNA interferase family)